MRTFSLILGLAGCAGESPPEPVSTPEPTTAEVPNARLYDLSFNLESMDGKVVGLDHFQGHPVVMAMFYASCPQACPLLIGKIQSIDAKLEPAQREKLRVLLVSMDPGRDSPQALSESFSRYNLDDNRWLMVRPQAEDVRTIAALLDVRYKQSADGEFNHNSGVTIVDAQGRIRLRVEGLTSEENQVIELLQSLL